VTGSSASDAGRVVFKTSRLLDFLSAKELVAQTGHAVVDWPLVALKELVDNALDECEEEGIAPVIAVLVDERGITVSDNGRGIPAEAVGGVVDFSVRASSREAYVAPDRGAQGNALATLVAMPFVLDGERGRVDICGEGVLSQITLSVDHIQQRPRVGIETSVSEGSFVRLYWPQRASSLTRVEARFLQLADDFTFLNPHLTLTMNWFGRTRTTVATDPSWPKWTPSSPTCAHWYRPEDLARLIAAYLAHDLDGGDTRTVREFVDQFRGLRSTVKQKRVLAASGLSRAPLSALTADGIIDVNTVGRLLAAMRRESKPVKPQALGVIGCDHVAARFHQLGVNIDSFQYAKSLTSDPDGLPQVTEVAFAARDGEASSRRFVCGVNWSASWVNPFRSLGAGGRSLDSMLAEWRAERDEPIVLLAHVVHPRVQYLDRGKSAVVAGGDRTAEAGDDG
jgi:hypothetical protein